jgi:predicted metalloprotease
MGSRLRRFVAFGALVALVTGAAACGGGGGDDASTDTTEGHFSRDDSTFNRDDTDETTTTVDEASGVDLDDVPQDDQDDVIIEAAITDIESFWTDHFNDIVPGVEFQPVEGGHFPYGPDRDLPECGGPETYEDIAQNAFYCPANDIIAWDTDNLTNQMLEQFGPFSLVIVMAHEYGHAIQARGALDPTLPTIAGEEQADCFAGAFTSFVADGGSDDFTVTDTDLDSAVAGFLSLRDAPGTPTDDPSAHGSAFDRVGAFQDGFLNGIERCAEYEDIYASGGTTAIPLQFTSDEDFQSGGNAPFDPSVAGNIFDLTFGSLETFWSQALPQNFGVDWTPLFPDKVVAFSVDDPDSLPPCPGVDDLSVEDAAGQAFTCFGDPDTPDDDYIAFDQDLASEQYNDIGDFAVSGVISQQYSFIAQVLLGNLESDKPSYLQADCFSGSWAAELTIDTLQDGGQTLDPQFDPNDIGAVSISAGDLDEAVQSFLLLGKDNDPSVQGTTFERVAAFRDGFLNGLDSCKTYLDDGAPSAEDGLPEQMTGQGSGGSGN